MLLLALKAKIIGCDKVVLLTLPDACRYVCRKNTTTNAVYVSRQYYADMHLRNRFWCHRFSWIDSDASDARPVHLQCKVRHGPAMFWATLQWNDRGTCADVSLDVNDQGLAPGQFAVFYQDGVCLGSAVICSRSEAATEGTIAAEGVIAGDAHLDCKFESQACSP